MSFTEYEESRSLGQPDTLYRFTIGNSVYAYTDGEDAVVYASVTYQPIPIDRDSVSTSGTLDKSSLKVMMPHDTPIAELFKVFPPSEVVALTIFQGHGNDEANEYSAIWVGRVLSCKREGSEASLDCEPISTSMRRTGLRIRDQYQCMHALYGPSCGVNRAAFTSTATVVGINGAFVTLASGWNGSMAESRFTNGILRWTVDGRTEQRSILKVNTANNRLHIGGTMPGLGNGSTVEVSRGCNHNSEHCNEFSNILNFGGCKWIPKTNPIGMRNTFF
jgi:hypothetical protein